MLIYNFAHQWLWFSSHRFFILSFFKLLSVHLWKALQKKIFCHWTQILKAMFSSDSWSFWESQLIYSLLRKENISIFKARAFNCSSITDKTGIWSHNSNPDFLQLTSLSYSNWSGEFLIVRISYLHILRAQECDRTCLMSWKTFKKNYQSRLT